MTGPQDQNHLNDNFEDEEGKRDIWAKEKDFRLYLERMLIEKKVYNVFDQFYGILAFISSIVNVLLGYFQSFPNYDKIYSWYETVDYIVCFFFLFVYCVKLYVAQHRIQYLMSIQSILNLMVIVPILCIIPSDRQSTSYYLVVFSRYVRFINCGIILTKYYKLGHTDVDRQIKIVMMTMVLLMYVSSGVYGVLEDVTMMFHDALYFVVVTLFTVGYGDIYP